MRGIIKRDRLRSERMDGEREREKTEDKARFCWGSGDYITRNLNGEWLTGRQGQEGLAEAVVKVGCQVGPVVQ